MSALKTPGPQAPVQSDSPASDDSINSRAASSDFLRLYNTLGRVKQNFSPIDPDHVRVYVCGPTVYDAAHIGNARPVVVFDLLMRLLRRCYPKVTYVRNITDIDDKIIEAAARNGESIAALTARTTAAFHDDMAALGAEAPDIEPRATDHIPAMVAMISTLIHKRHAYVVDGHVLFHIPSVREYGRLSGRARADMIAGARVEVAAGKKDPADFVLWKPSSPDQPGWDSPWGRGRPGWHIECSAMSAAYLGPVFDIHGGGIDLLFPHHENEMMQSCCAHGGRDMARFWLHNGYLTIDGEKMSKSLGNVVTVNALRRCGWPGEVIRLALLSAHYRQPLDFSQRRLNDCRCQLDRLYGALRGAGGEDGGGDSASGLSVAVHSRAQPVQDALCDDLNTPAAIGALHDMAHGLNKAKGQKGDLAAALRAGGALLGLLGDSPSFWFKRPPVRMGGAHETPSASPDTVAGGEIPDEGWINDRIAARLAARRAGDYEHADAIRDALESRGILLEDGPERTLWRWKT